MIKFLKFFLYLSVFSLIIFSLYPGSLIGFLLYEDLGRQPDLVKNPFGTAINHFISYIYVSLLGSFLYLRKNYFHKFLYFMLILSIILEFIQLIVPNRAFEIVDLIANILGVIVAYLIVKIYLFFNKL